MGLSRVCRCSRCCPAGDAHASPRHHWRAGTAIRCAQGVGDQEWVEYPVPTEQPGVFLGDVFAYYRPGPGGGDDVDKVLRTRGIEGDGRHLTGGDGTGQPGDVDHLDDLDRCREDALELDDARRSAPPERQGPKTYDDRHLGSFWAEMASSA